jgi:branched-chain amino acid transport system ATP-binding protein
MNSSEALLRLDDVHAYYGLSHVLQGVNLQVPAGAIVSLMGRNGVGKTTTLKSVFGLAPVREGRISFAGESRTGLRTHQIARRGIAMVPEDRRIFSSLSVAENILLAAGGCSDAIAEATEWFGLRNYLRRPGDQLPAVERQMRPLRARSWRVLGSC